MAKRQEVRGRDYFENAAKQIPWPVDVGAKSDDYKGQIHVPHFDMDRATEHLMVQHLMGLGYTIQSTIAEVNQTKVFDPVIRLSTYRPIPKEKPKDGFIIGDRFEIVSSRQRLEITDTRNGITLHYINVGKLDIKTSISQLEKSLNLEVWKRL